MFYFLDSITVSIFLEEELSDIYCQTHETIMGRKWKEYSFYPTLLRLETRWKVDLI